MIAKAWLLLLMRRFGKILSAKKILSFFCFLNVFCFERCAFCRSKIVETERVHLLIFVVTVNNQIFGRSNFVSCSVFTFVSNQNQNLVKKLEIFLLCEKARKKSNQNVRRESRTRWRKQQRASGGR